MKAANQAQDKNQPSLAEIMTGYLQRQMEDHADGLATFDSGGEVQPYEAGPVQPIDARPAWEEATAVIQFAGGSSDGRALKAPPGWPTLVAAHEPAFDLALCLGNFPQLVRDLHRLMAAQDLVQLRQSAGKTAVDVPGLGDSANSVAAKRQFPQLLLAIGALRLAKQFALAERLLRDGEPHVPAEWRSLWDNEKAALAWHKGDSEGARRLWQAQPESVIVHFNRGMANLFTGHLDEARADLARAVAQLPESSAWHHLGRLYATLAEGRR